jgi:hypothetical protein
LVKPKFIEGCLSARTAMRIVFKRMKVKRIFTTQNGNSTNSKRLRIGKERVIVVSANKFAYAALRPK